MSDIQLKYNDIFHAILSMDVYHRGVNSAITVTVTEIIDSFSNV